MFLDGTYLAGLPDEIWFWKTQKSIEISWKEAEFRMLLPREVATKIRFRWCVKLK